MAVDAVCGRDTVVRQLGFQSFHNVAIGTLLVSATLVVAFPVLDLRAAHLFFAGGRSFAGNTPAIAFARSAFVAAFAIACCAGLTGVVLTYAWKRSWLGLNFSAWLFFVACLGAGPGLVSNMTFKDHWGRARPNQIVEFGGEKRFTPAPMPANQCLRNCSFVSGEASSIFMLFFAASYLSRTRRQALFAAGIAAGSFAGLIRMSQGGHFLSDVIFAAILMALTAAAIERLFASWEPGSGI